MATDKATMVVNALKVTGKDALAWLTAFVQGATGQDECTCQYILTAVAACAVLAFYRDILSRPAPLAYELADSTPAPQIIEGVPVEKKKVSRSVGGVPRVSQLIRSVLLGDTGRSVRQLFPSSHAT
jgi:hypothetical protein